MKKTQYQTDILERFIPIGIERLVDDLLATNRLNPESKSLFKKFYKYYSRLFHAQTHTECQKLKYLYQPFNPDKEILTLEHSSGSKQLSDLKTKLNTILNNANYEKISALELNETLNKTSPLGVKVSVDFEEFNDVSLFFRGSAIQTEFRRDFKRFKFKKRQVNILIYRRLFVLLQPRNRQEWIDHLITTKKISHKKAEKQVDNSLKALGINGPETIIYLKVFKNIPRADLEMLFPNTRIQIRLFDKIKLGLMGGGGTAGGIMATISKFSAAIDPVSAIIAIGGLLGVIWRQISKIFSQRAKYSAILTKNLYFYNLNNNMGALSYLADSAEAEECKEVILAYFFLLAEGKSTQFKLDKCIEDYMNEQYDLPMDFEIDDGLNKLKQANLLDQDNETISVLSLKEANASLIKQWNDTIIP